MMFQNIGIVAPRVRPVVLLLFLVIFLMLIFGAKETICVFSESDDLICSRVSIITGGCKAIKTISCFAANSHESII